MYMSEIKPLRMSEGTSLIVSVEQGGTTRKRLLRGVAPQMSQVDSYLVVPTLFLLQVGKTD